MADARLKRSAVAMGPPSLSNLGPGFDTLGLCFKGPSDTVKATLTNGREVTVSSDVSLPADPMKNTAGRAAKCVLDAAEATCGIHLKIKKGITIGSGIGGSAASAAAGAWATNLALGRPLEKVDLVKAVLEGESVASGGAYHGDNALPSLLGGLVLTSPVCPSDYRQIKLKEPLFITILLPKHPILTAEARSILPDAIPMRTAVENASDLALLLYALSEGDYADAGRYMMRDRIAEPARSTLLPFYEDVRAAAMKAGAWACAITGSGPAMFATAPRRPGCGHSSAVHDEGGGCLARRNHRRHPKP